MSELLGKDSSRDSKYSSTNPRSQDLEPKVKEKGTRAILGQENPNGHTHSYLKTHFPFLSSIFKKGKLLIIVVESKMLCVSLSLITFAN